MTIATDVALSVCVFVKLVSCAKMAEPTEMPVGEMTHVGAMYACMYDIYFM